MKNSQIGQTLLALLIITIFSLFATRDLWQPGFFTTHDAEVHVMRLAQFDQALKEGQFPVRWLPNWMAGYGSPVFNFNFSLPYYLGSLLHFTGLSFQDCVKVVFILSVVLSAWTGYLFIFQIIRDRIAAIVGSVLYVWAPYRFTDIYIRGAWGEACSFIFLPLILWFLIKAKKNLTVSIWAGVVWALFITTHNILALVSMGLYFAYTVFLPEKWPDKIKLVKSAELVFLLGLGLSAWFWLPALAEKKYDSMSAVANIYNYSQQFVSPTALFTSGWQYKLALPDQQSESMSFQLGWIHWLVVGIVIYYLLKKSAGNKDVSRQMKFFLLVFLAAILLCTKASKFIYDIPLVSGMINFPWRFLEIATFAAAILAGLLLTLFKRRQMLIGSILISMAVFLYWPYSKIISERFSLSDERLENAITSYKGFYPDTEYLPIWANYFGLLKNRGPAASFPFFISKEKATFTQVQRYKLNYFSHITTEQPTQVSAQAFYFPGWQVTIDGHTQETDRDEYGLVSFVAPAGNHDIRLELVDTKIRKVGNWISIISVVGLAGLIGYQLINKSRKKSIKL